MTESEMKSKYNEESAKKVVRVVLHDDLPTREGKETFKYKEG